MRVRRQARVGIAGVDHTIVIEVLFCPFANIDRVGNAVAITILALGNEGSDGVLRRMDRKGIGLGAEHGIGGGTIDRVDRTECRALMGGAANEKGTVT